MKKYIVICILMMLFISQKVLALTFEEAYIQTSSKPMVVLIYAQWADNYQNILSQFRTLKSKFKNQFNFVELDIASQDAKNFNTRYKIYPNLPYIMMFKNGGNVSRQITRDCASDLSCVTSKLKSFIE